MARSSFFTSVTQPLHTLCAKILTLHSKNEHERDGAEQQGERQPLLNGDLANARHNPNSSADVLFRPLKVQSEWHGMDAFDWQWRSSKSFIVVVICIATFTDGFIYGLSVPAIPFLLRSQGSVSEDQRLSLLPNSISIK
jgi:hypothetical protein